MKIAVFDFGYVGSVSAACFAKLGHKVVGVDVDSQKVDAINNGSSPIVEKGLDEIIRQTVKAGQLRATYNTTKVAMLELTFKPGTDDLRESPYLEVAERLIGKGYRLSIFDSNLQLDKLVGQNKAFVEKHLPHLVALLKPSAEDVLQCAEIVVAGTSARAIEPLLGALSTDVAIVDLVRLGDKFLTRRNYYGICW